jgi:hypothetical protein
MLFMITSLLFRLALVNGVSRHFQQYFSYIVVASFIGGVPGENHRPVASH